MPERTLIQGGTLFTETGAMAADVLVGEDGRIEAIQRRERNDLASSEAGSAADGARIVSAEGLWVLPGGVDAHVHFRDPGLTHKEDFTSGSLSAALGGVTTVLDMPNTLPPVTDGACLRDKLGALTGRSYVDYGLFGAAVAGGDVHRLIDFVQEMMAGGSIGIKVFLGPTTGNLSAPSWGDLYQLLSHSDRKTVYVFHCEDRSVIEQGTASVPEADRRSYSGLLAARPRFGELFATDGVLRLAAETGARVHVAHVALAEAAAAIALAKKAGAPVTSETCPQYLFLDETAYESIGSVMKVLPPIRSAEDRMRLWQALKEGAIDFVATDHAPHERADVEGGKIWEGLFGMAGVQTLLPLLLDFAANGECGPHDVVRWTSAAPARAFGLYPRKGALAPGSDADIVVVDPNAQWCVDERWWRSKSRNTAFWGRTGRGLPVLTMVRGHIVVQGGDVVGAPAGRPVQSVP